MAEEQESAKERREVRIANRDAHLKMGQALALWRDTGLMLAIGSVAISLLNMADKRPHLVCSLAVLLIAAVSAFLSATFNIRQHARAQELYAAQLIGDADSNAQKPNLKADLDRAGRLTTAFFYVALVLFVAGCIHAGAILAAP
jgi:hypothetical protein